MTDAAYMEEARKLAEKGCGFVNPNPMVGAVIVKDGQIIGQGWHERYGELHAERKALENCMESPQGATLYVTLEPCCHYGKTPPCTEAIIQSGISKVVIGSRDPNPLVAGKGAAMLRAHGIQVVEGVEKEACDRLNQVFFHYIRTKRPYVVMKYAMTMDGKIATSTGASKWITGETAREQVHKDRHRYTAIMVGVGTVMADNPMLTCRMEGGRNPIRIICDTRLRTPMTAHVVTTAGQVPTMIATACQDAEKLFSFQKAGCEVLVVPEKEGHLQLTELMIQLGKKGIDSILLEGGSTLNWAAIESNIVQKVQTYLAPKLFGGRNAPSPLGGIGIASPEHAVTLGHTVIYQVGEDYLLESEVLDSCLRES